MANLDVTDVLDDPDFWSDLVLIKSVIQINELGLANAISAGEPFRGVAQPPKGKGLVQTIEGDYVKADLMVWTRYPLDTGNRDDAADVIVYAGLPYLVTNAAPWLYGPGYIQAFCDLLTINPSVSGRQNDAGYLG